MQITMMRHFIIHLLCWLPLPLLAEATSKAETLTRSEPFSVMGMLNMVFGLVVVIALILGLAWVLRKYGRLPVTNQVEMKVLGGLSLGTRERAVLVEVEGKRLLLGVAPGRIATLLVMDDDRSGFKQQLANAMDKPA
ncbi:MAG: flagellar biosynthetic protein FliO [Gammaproteobacteria bacterium]|nr:MAG: flagellar biosynthetic protein FliO [Gammaproteobacteria bacterium]